MREAPQVVLVCPVFFFFYNYCAVWYATPRRGTRIIWSSADNRMFRCLHAGDLDAVVCPELVADGGLSHYLLSVHEACSRISGLGRKAHYNPRIIESAVLEGDSTDQHDRREHYSLPFAQV